jgi:hypothetical protein
MEAVVGPSAQQPSNGHGRGGYLRQRQESGTGTFVLRVSRRRQLDVTEVSLPGLVPEHANEIHDPPR